MCFSSDDPERVKWRILILIVNVMAKTCPIIKLNLYFQIECETDQHLELDAIKARLLDIMDEELSKYKISGNWINSNRVVAVHLSTQDALEKLRKGK